MAFANPTDPTPSRAAIAVLAAGALWAAGVVWFAARGALIPLIGVQYALLVVAGIAIPTVIYAFVPAVQRLVDRAGLYWVTLIHVWRVPAGLLFIGYGLMGQLPPAFWIPAGFGDLLVGVYAARLLFRNGEVRYYTRFHLLGFADFVIAVGAGLVHTLMLDPRMAPLAALPLALIPLFGVGISGASHLIAFYLLGRAHRASTPATEAAR
jgi:hypothetical protein